MPPVSARSTHSQLSMAEADSVWSDGEEGSLFSSGDANKPTLAQLHKNAQSQVCTNLYTLVSVDCHNSRRSFLR